MADSVSIAPQFTFVDNFVYADGVKIGRLLPEQRALEFMAPRPGRRHKERRTTVISLDDTERLISLCRARAEAA